jgi:hypothetical protein
MKFQLHFLGGREREGQAGQQSSIFKVSLGLGEIERKKAETEIQRDIEIEGRDWDTERYRDIEAKRHRDRADSKNPEQSWVAQLVQNRMGRNKLYSIDNKAFWISNNLPDKKHNRWYDGKN